MFEYLLDLNFYNSIPIYQYILGGFVILFIGNCIFCSCCVTSNKKIKNKLELRELDLESQELKLNRQIQKFEKQKREKDIRDVLDKDYDDIVLTTPALYKLPT